MSSIRTFFARLRAACRARDLDRDFEREMDAHLAMLVDDLVANGMSVEEATRAARLRLGPAESLKARHRDTRGFPALDSLWQDVRFALRLTWKERWFSAAAIAALAIGLAANAIGFSMVDAAFLRGLPFPDADRLVKVGWQTRSGRVAQVSYPELEEFRRGAGSVEIAAFHDTSVNISDDRATPEHTRGMWVTANVFRVLRQPPLLGRDFTPEEEQPGASAVVIIGHAIWVSRYGADPGVLGRQLRINGRPATIVGVMPPGMHFEDNARLWAPLVPTGDHRRVDFRMLNAFGRLGDGGHRAETDAELDAVAARLAAAHPESTRTFMGARVEFYGIAGFARTVLATTMVASAFVLLIACANVANLLLARSVYRAREIALRVAVGATRARIVRQLLIESVLLAFAGAALGLVLAALGIDGFETAMRDSEKPYWLVFTVDANVVVYVAALSLLTTVLFGLVPALQVSNTNANEWLKEGGRGGSDGRRTRWFSSSLVIAELALTIVLVAGAGFLLRSFVTLYSLDVGFDTERLVTVQLELSDEKYRDPASRRKFFEQIRARVAGVPGVQSTALTTRVPPASGGERMIEVDGATLPDAPRFVSTVIISPEFFGVIDRQVLRGRNFDQRDGEPGRETVVVNPRLAAMVFGTADPLGRRIRFRPLNAQPGETIDIWRTVVGVSAPIRQGEPENAYGAPVAYLPFRQEAPAAATLLVRSALPPEQLVAAVGREVRAEDPDQPIFAVQTAAELLERDRWPYRIFGTLFAGLAAASLVLSGVGLYALMAYAVSRRTHEIGVRMAVGASRTHVMWLILGRGLVQLAIGLPIGLAGAVMLGGVLDAMLVDMTPTDPLTLAGVMIVLTLVTVGACLVPTSRALRVDPLEALRAE